MRVTVTGIEGPDGLAALAAEYDEAAGIAPAEARKVVQRGALNIKRDWRKAWTGLSHAPRLPYAVGYDTQITPAGAVAEIGPDKDLENKQGALGNLIEYGSVNNAPKPGGAPALKAEEPKFLQALEDLALRSIGGEP